MAEEQDNSQQFRIRLQQISTHLDKANTDLLDFINQLAQQSQKFADDKGPDSSYLRSITQGLITALNVQIDHLTKQKENLQKTMVPKVEGKSPRV